MSTFYQYAYMTFQIYEVGGMPNITYLLYVLDDDVDYSLVQKTSMSKHDRKTFTILSAIRYLYLLLGFVSVIDTNYEVQKLAEWQIVP